MCGRFGQYIEFVKRYPKMQCNEPYFFSRMLKVEKLLGQTKSWRNGNKGGEKAQFLEHFLDSQSLTVRLGA